MIALVLVLDERLLHRRSDIDFTMVRSPKTGRARLPKDPAV
jgi:hypothetical protein